MWAVNKVLSDSPIKHEGGNISKVLTPDMALAKYYYQAGRQDALRELYSLGYSIEDFKKLPGITTPQFREEKPL